MPFNHALITRRPTTDYTVSELDDLILVDTSAGAVAIVLPGIGAANAPNYVKHIFVVQKITSDANAVTVSVSGGALINGAATYVVSGQWDNATFSCDDQGAYVVSNDLSGNFTTLVTGQITGNDSSLGIDGLSSGTGGAVALSGGASSTAATAGGAITAVGGTGNTSGAGGAIGLTGGVGGTTAAGGNVALTGGRGGSTSGAAGTAIVTGGAGGATPSTVTGGVASLVGGASAAGATGRGGAAKVTGGAAISTAGDGGAAIIAGGVKTTTGFAGPVVLGNAQLMPIWYPQAAPAADGADTPFTATVAQLIAGMISMTPTTGRAITTPTGAEMDLGVAFADVPATFGFDFTIQNRAAFAATDDIITLVAGATGATVTGSAVVSPGSAARFRAVRTAADTWIFYKIAG